METMSEGGFLSRWSRRKREVEQAKRATGDPSEQTPPVEEVSAGAGGPVRASRFEGQDAEALPELSAEEIARLPHVEDLTGASDLTQFLREGVPQALRNAALRRTWVLDPAIRDYVSEAREYAYDWNTPGGVPGSGPLLASDDVEAMVRRVIGDRETQPRPEAESAAEAAEGERSTKKGEPDPEIAPGDAPNEPASDQEPAAVPRRHGGATPV
jgi:hypothetical protein